MFKLAGQKFYHRGTTKTVSDTPKIKKHWIQSFFKTLAKMPKNVGGVCYNLSISKKMKVGSKMDILEKVVKQRLANAKATAKHFDECGYDESAEFWHSVAGILEAILDEAEIWA